MERFLLNVNFEQLLGGQNCLVACYMYILYNLGKEWSYLFSGLWRLETTKGGIFEHILYEKLGLREKKEKVSVEHYIETVNYELKHHSQIIVEVDLYYCPWSKSYMEAHGIHDCILKKVSLKEEKYYFIDRIVGNGEFLWDSTLFLKALKRTYIYESVEETAHLTCKEVLRNLVDNFPNGCKDVTEMFKLLRNQFFEFHNLRVLFEQIESGSCIAILMLKQFQMVRLGISYLLFNIYRDNPIAGDVYLIALDFYKSQERFKRLSGFLYKLYYTDRCDMDAHKKLMDYLTEIKVFELQIFNRISNIIGQKN